MNKRSNVIVAMLLIALVSSLALGQRTAAPSQQQTTKGAVVKGKAPVNKEVLKVKLPRAQEATLKNGLQVILLESHKVPTFNMQLTASRVSPQPCCAKAPASVRARTSPNRLMLSAQR
jgi:hypothetical protein